MPFAPGTFGTLLGLPLAWGTQLFTPTPWLQALVAVAICVLGVLICTKAASLFGGEKDPQQIVLDEIAAVPHHIFSRPARDTLEAARSTGRLRIVPPLRHHQAAAGPTVGTSPHWPWESWPMIGPRGLCLFCFTYD